jgi:hypothetical protein
VKVADADAAVSFPPLAHRARISLLELTHPFFRSRVVCSRRRRVLPFCHRRSSPGTTSLFRLRQPSFGSP